MSTEPAGGRHAQAGTIHDIGYRHYSGPRLGRGPILRALYWEGLRGAYGFGRSARSKVMPLLVLTVMTLPALVIAVVSATTGQELVTDYRSYTYSNGLIVAIFLATVAPGLVSRDLRFRTISLYFSRPLHRTDYVLARYAAAVSATAILVMLPLTVLLGGALLAKLPVKDQLTGYLTAVAGGALLCLLLPGLALLIASITPRRGFGVAAVIAVLLVLNTTARVLQSLAVEQGSDRAAGYLGAIDPFTLVDGVQSWLLDTTPNSPAGPPGTTGGLVFCALTVGLIGTVGALLLLRYRKVSVS